MQSNVSSPIMQQYNLQGLQGLQGFGGNLHLRELSI